MKRKQFALKILEIDVDQSTPSVRVSFGEHYKELQTLFFLGEDFREGRVCFNHRELVEKFITLYKESVKGDTFVFSCTSAYDICPLPPIKNEKDITQKMHPDSCPNCGSICKWVNGALCCQKKGCHTVLCGI
jgi:hypothetical protein